MRDCMTNGIHTKLIIEQKDGGDGTRLDSSFIQNLIAKYPRACNRSLTNLSTVGLSPRLTVPSYSACKSLLSDLPSQWVISLLAFPTSEDAQTSSSTSTTTDPFSDRLSFSIFGVISYQGKQIFEREQQPWPWLVRYVWIVAIGILIRITADDYRYCVLLTIRHHKSYTYIAITSRGTVLKEPS